MKLVQRLYGDTENYLVTSTADQLSLQYTNSKDVLPNLVWQIGARCCYHGDQMHSYIQYQEVTLTVSSAALQHAYDDPLTRPPTINAGIIIIM